MNKISRHLVLNLNIVVLMIFPIITISQINPPTSRPNIVIIFMDDMGYSDIGPFGNKEIPTPNLDQMEKEGVKFSRFYAAQAVCSASRAALLTGTYPNRIGISMALNHRSSIGLNPEEITIAEVVKPLGYRTAIFGKWHLGHHPDFLPTKHGFDKFFGLPYSNDMWPFHPENKGNYPPLPLYEDETIVRTLDDQSMLTTWYTEHAVDFIKENKEQPFFIY